MSAVCETRSDWTLTLGYALVERHKLLAGNVMSQYHQHCYKRVEPHSTRQSKPQNGHKRQVKGSTLKEVSLERPHFNQSQEVPILLRSQTD